MTFASVKIPVHVRWVQALLTGLCAFPLAFLLYRLIVPG